MIIERMGAETVAIPYFQDDWGIFVGEATEAEVEKRGGEVVLREAMTPQARDFRSMITKIRALQPDAIFIASHYAPSAIFMQQLRQAGIDIPVAGADPLYNPEFVRLAGDAADGLITTTYFFPTDPTKADFVNAYEEKYGRKPDLWAAFAYDAIQITAAAAADVIESGEPLTRAALCEAIDALPPFEGVTGVTEFVDGTPEKPMTLLTIRDGEYALLEEPAN
jgi:branched-chain amino acid transport system substrate-binding protein